MLGENDENKKVLPQIGALKFCDDRIQDDEFMKILNDVLNPQEYPKAVSFLSQYLKKRKIEEKFFETICSMLDTVHNWIRENRFQDQNHLYSIINFFFFIIYDDITLSNFLISKKIHLIFFPFINLLPTLQLFRELLYLNKAPNDLNQKKISRDHDERQNEYESICIQEGYNIVAHDFISNNIEKPLFSILNTELKCPVLDVITQLGFYFFSFENFLPFFDQIFQIIFNNEEEEINRIKAINSINGFAGSSRKAINYFLSNQYYIKLFADYPFPSPNVSRSILSCAENAMSISNYFDFQNALLFLNFSLPFLQSSDIDTLSYAVCAIYKGARIGEAYVSYCLEHGIIFQLFQLLEKSSISFNVQTDIFIGICFFFLYSDFNAASGMVEMSFFQVISDFLESMTQSSDALISALDALNHALFLSEVNETNWIDIIADDENIIQVLEDIDSGPYVGDYRDESPEIIAHSFLDRLNRLR